MLEPGHRARLDLEALAPRELLRQHLVEHLDRDDPAELDPLGAIHRAHRALGYRLEDPVPALEKGAGKIAVFHRSTIPQVVCSR